MEPAGRAMYRTVELSWMAINVVLTMGGNIIDEWVGICHTTRLTCYALKLRASHLDFPLLLGI